MFDPIGVAFSALSFFYNYLIPSGYCISRSLTLKRSYIYRNILKMWIRPPWGRILYVIIFYKYLIPLGY